jgi:cysteine desulfurase
VTAPASLFCDHNAGGPADPDVLAAFVETERRCPGNPASVHQAGRSARAVLEQARERIANAVGVAAADVVFTSGGTEAANLAVLGLGDPTRPVLVAPTEHPCVLEPAALRGIEPWPVQADGSAIVQRPERRVGLLCLVHGQSELGTLQPVLAAADLAVALDVPLFVDAAQTLGRVPLAPIVARGAVLGLSPHKAGGLRGFGALVGHELHRRLRPLLRGGGQELGLRPGTQSPALAIANALAIERAIAEQATRAAAMHAARAALLAGIVDSGVDHRLLTPLPNSLPNTAMLHFPHVDGRNLVPTLDLAGVQASHGSACSSGAPVPPRILLAIGLEKAAARACVRFSLGHRDEPTTMHDAGLRIGATVARRQKKI